MGLPIALSTATWYLDGMVSNPQGQDQNSTLATQDWNQLLSSGAGLKPAQGAPRPNVSWSRPWRRRPQISRLEL